MPGHDGDIRNWKTNRKWKHCGCGGRSMWSCSGLCWLTVTGVNCSTGVPPGGVAGAVIGALLIGACAGWGYTRLKYCHYRLGSFLIRKKTGTHQASPENVIPQYRDNRKARNTDEVHSGNLNFNNMRSYEQIWILTIFGICIFILKIQ